MQRYLSIDILRGMAIVLMIQVHFVENLSPREGSSTWLYDAAIIMGGFPAPFFTFVSGLSYGLWLRKQEAASRRDSEITIITLRRGLFLFGTGLAFNFFLWLPEETFNWDILTLIGTSFLFLAFARKLPSSILALICLIVVLLSPLLRVVGDFSSHWVDHSYAYDFNFHEVLFGFFSNGYFPVFPWIIFPIVGFISGDLIFPRRRPSNAVLWRLSTVGIGLLALSGLAVAAGALLPSFFAQPYANGITEFPASTTFVLALLGCTLLSLLLLNRWVDRNQDVSHAGRFITMIRRFSSFSLTVYIVHHMVILWPLWIYGERMDNEDATIYWRKAMSTPLAFGLAVAFMAICHFGLTVLEKHKKYSLEALMRWLCD